MIRNTINHRNTAIRNTLSNPVSNTVNHIYSYTVIHIDRLVTTIFPPLQHLERGYYSSVGGSEGVHP